MLAEQSAAARERGSGIVPVLMTERRDGEAEVGEDGRDPVVGVGDYPDCCVGC